MTIYEQALTDLAFIYSELGISATYTSIDDFPSSISYIPEKQDPATQEPSLPGDEKIISVMISEVSSPKRGDQFTISGETWYFLAIIDGCEEDGEWTLRISRSERRQL